jgi:hypothetical protein
MSTQPPNIFQQLLSTDVKQYVEKKGKFSYLSWSYAIAELRKADPTATWHVVKSPLPDAPHVLAPYCSTPAGCFVEVAVTVQGVTLSQVHPVIDERNQTIANPKADAINKSIMRCLVKAIALHGLGLHIYAGEDLPLGDDAEEPKGKPAVQQQQRQQPAAPAPAVNPDAKAIDLAKVIATADETSLKWCLDRVLEVTDETPRGKSLAFALGAAIERRFAALDNRAWEAVDGSPAAKETHAKKLKAVEWLAAQIA